MLYNADMPGKLMQGGCIWDMLCLQDAQRSLKHVPAACCNLKLTSLLLFITRALTVGVTANVLLCTHRVHSTAPASKQP